MINYLWSLLPDKCQQKNCSRKGVRGNEQWVNNELMCDDCHGKVIRAKALTKLVKWDQENNIY